MEISIAQQAWTFLGAFALGAALGLLYDLFRILRIAVTWNGFWIFFQDLIFWVCSAFFIFSYIGQTNSGEIRWYIFFGTLCGAVLYFMTFSVLLIKSARAIIRATKRALRFLLRLILAPVVLIHHLLRPIWVLRGRKLRNTKKVLQKHFQNAQKRDRMERNSKDVKRVKISGVAGKTAFRRNYEKKEKKEDCI